VGEVVGIGGVVASRNCVGHGAQRAFKAVFRSLRIRLAGASSQRNGFTLPQCIASV
jgi:uncharacterized protein (DUF2267 family)